MEKFYFTKQQSPTYYQTVIKNQYGKPAYLLVGRWGNEDDILTLYQLDGSLEVEVKQTSNKRKYRFDLYQKKKKVGTVQKLFPLSFHFYFIKHLTWFVIGLGYHHFEVRHFTQPIMTIKKISSPLGETYQLDIFEQKDIPICICIAAIIDYWLLKKETILDIQPVQSKKILSDLA